MDISQKIKNTLIEAFSSLYGSQLPEHSISLQPTRKEFEGTYTFVVFPFLKYTNKKPEESGEEIGDFLKNHLNEISSFNVVKGFLNLSLSDRFWLEQVTALSKNSNAFQLPPTDKKVMVEYSSPNTNKPLHLGHLRNNFLGYSLSEILKANGHQVIKANLVNDRGIHICKSMVAYQEFGDGETPQTSGIKGDHLVGKYYVVFDKAYKEEVKKMVGNGMEEEKAKREAPLMLKAQDMLLQWEKGVPAVVELWKTMNQWVYEGFESTYKRMGVDFDQMYYESDTYLLGKDMVEEGLSKGVFFKKENGSIWANLSDEGLDEKLVLRADGTSVYITQDMGTADLKYKDHRIDTSVYVVGNEQDYHFDVLFKILKKLQRPYSDGLYHLSYGMVDLPSGKMKSREGTVVDADDLIAEMVETAKNINT
jgi:arginyl-tRNA synthetase